MRRWPWRSESGFAADAADPDRDEPRFERTLDDGIARIAIALVEAGPLNRGELAERVNAGAWGAGRFNEALTAAEREGHVEQVGTDRFAAPVPRYSRHS